MARRRKEEAKVLSKRNIVGIFIVGIMVLSGLGYMMERSGNSTTDYQGRKFEYINNIWHTEIGGSTVRFTFHPSELERLNVSADIIEYLKNVKMFYITFDPNSSLIEDFELFRLELETELPEYFTIYPTTAVTFNTTTYAAFPVITCANATVFIPVVYLTQGEQTDIIGNGTCITLQVKEGYDVPALKDRLMYGLFGIM